MPRYALIQRLLHWAIALVVLGALAIGLIFAIYDGFAGTKEAFGEATTNLFYKYHKTFGVIILFAMIVRILVKLRLGKPAYAQPLSRFEHVASNAVHGLLYLGLLIMPVLGWLGTAAGGFPVQFFGWTLPGLIGKDKALYEILMEFHGVIGWIMLICVLMHIGGALKHWLVNKDGVMTRMSLF